MTDNIDSDNLSYSAKGENKISARALMIEPVYSSQNIEFRTHCPKCSSRVIVFTSNDGRDMLDLNYKRHFCEAEDRRRHEDECMIRLVKLVDDYNRIEFSSFQVELNIP